MKKGQATVEETVLKNLKKNKRKRIFKKLKGFMILILIISGIIFYLKNDISKVSKFTVIENKFYTNNQILKIANLDDKTYFLKPSFLIENDLKNNPLINNAEVKKTLEREFIISIQESKVIGYLSENSNKVLIQDIGICEIDKYNKMSLPRIVGFNENELVSLKEGFKNVDEKMIGLISEILPHSETYNDDMVMLIMNDGNKIISDYKGLYLLNNYTKVLPQLKGSHIYLYMDYMSGNIIKKAENSQETHTEDDENYIDENE